MNLVEKIYTKVSRKGRYLQRDLAHGTGIYNDFYKSARGSRIMVYHGICQQEPTKFNTLFLTLETFEAHLKFYQQHFNVVSLDDYYQQKFSSDRFNICLTFDDGFANNYKYVLPLLQRYKMPATFFVTAIRDAGYDILWNDFLTIASKQGPETIVFDNEAYRKDRHDKYVSVEHREKLADELCLYGFEKKAGMMQQLYPLVPFKANQQDKDYWLQMTAEQIRELSASAYASIGSHGYYHNDLAKISLSDAEYELIASKKYLEDLTQQEVKSLAFPYGSYTPELKAAAKQVGYEQLLATDFIYPEDMADNSLRERFTVNPFISVNNQMYATIIGKYE